MLSVLLPPIRPAAPTARDDEVGIAMILAVTVVMLMTLIPACDLHAGRAAAAARACTTRTTSRRSPRPRPASTTTSTGSRRTRTTGRTAPRTRRPTATWRSRAGSRCPGPNNNGEFFRYNVNTSQTASTGIVYLTSSGKSRATSCPHREGRTAPPRLPRLPVAHRLRDHRPVALGRELVALQVPRVGVEHA